MADQHHADLPKILRREAGQHLFVDLVCAKRRLVLLEPETTEPCRNVHARLPDAVNAAVIYFIANRRGARKGGLAKPPVVAWCSDSRGNRRLPAHPSVNDAGEAVERYLAVVNEASAERRRRLVAELWAVGGAHVTAASASTGHHEIAAAIAEAQAVFGSRGLAASPANRSQTHHQVAWFQWHLKAKNNDQVVAATSHLLILDEMGRIRFDYQFDEPA